MGDIIFPEKFLRSKLGTGVMNSKPNHPSNPNTRNEKGNKDESGVIVPKIVLETRRVLKALKDAGIDYKQNDAK